MAPLTSASVSDNRELPAEGVLITAVRPGSPAAQAGLKENDIIIMIDGQAARTPKLVTDTIQKAEPGHKLVLLVLHDHDRKMIVTLGPYE